MSNQDQALKSKSLIVRFGERFGVDEKKLFDTLKAVAFRKPDGTAPTNEQMMALLIVAEQYGLNPFTKEIYAYPDKNNGVVPVVGVDGWSRIVNSHPQFDGVEFVYSPEKVMVAGSTRAVHEWIECVMYRKDRARPYVIREFLSECYRAGIPKHGYTINGPWQTHTMRMLRHKAYIQAARIALGFSGIYDQDEAERIIDADSNTHGVTVTEVQPRNEAATAGVQTQAPSSENPQLTLQEIEPILNQVATRAISSKAWKTAHQYVEQRFTGENLEHAKQYLNDRQMSEMEKPVFNYTDSREVQQPTNDQYKQADYVPQTGSVMPPLEEERRSDVSALAAEDNAGSFY